MQKYSNESITVRYDEKKCIHAGICVRGLPAVFDVGKSPWVNVNGADVAAIKQAVAQCPSGALSCEEK
jgi:uncharacterized Fe-S cluster protein YjdI